MTPPFSIRALTPKPISERRLWVAHFGGLFNPVHDGHLSIGKRLIEEYGFDRVIYVPGSTHYPKADLAAEADRLAMLRLAIVHEPRFEVSDYELGKADWTQPLETLLYLRAKFSKPPQGARIFTIRGDDWLPQLLTWTEIADHEHLYEFIIVPRIYPDTEGVEIDVEHMAVVQRMTHLMLLPEPLDISATQVRKQLSTNCADRILIPAAVLEEIRRRGLYGVAPVSRLGEVTESVE